MTTLIGSLAGALTTACWLPQMLKTLRLRTAGDFAWPYLGMLLAGLVFWTVYGFLRHDPPIYVCNIVTGGFVVVVTMVKVRAAQRWAGTAEEVAMTVAVD